MNDAHFAPDQLPRQCGQPLILTVGPLVFDRDVAALDIAGLTKALLKCRTFMGAGTPAREDADHRHRRLLRARRQRPSRRAAEKGDEDTAPDHSITSSAMASSMGGMVTPSTLAVVMLISN